MKLILSKAALCLTALFVSAYADESEPISDLTLTSCPDTHIGLACGDKGLLKTATLDLDDSEHTAPYYRNSFYSYMLVWEAPYGMTWKVRDDKPVNISFRIGDYQYTEGLKPGQTSYDFTIQDMATKLTSNDNITEAEQMVLSGRVTFCLISLSHPDGPSDYSIGYSYLVTGQMYDTVTNEFRAQHELGENKVTKKWRLGVGIGVGIGAPVLMLASFLLGRRQGKKSSPALKMTS